MASPEFQAARNQWMKMRRWGWLTRTKITAKNLRQFMESSPRAPLPDGATETRADADGVPSVWLLGKGADPNKRILYLHGGGYVGGSINTHRTLCAYLSQECQMAVLLPDYRLAPEHQYPAALDDGNAAFSWMLQNGPNGPDEAAQTVIMGDSAGGGLTVGLVMARRDRGEQLPDKVVALSAWADMTCSAETMRTRAKADLICNQRWLDDCAQLYVGDDRRTPYASPVFGDFAGFPPTLLHVGDAEVLLDDSHKLADAARAAGVHVTLDIWPEMLHDWHLMAPMVPEANQAIEMIADYVNDA